jgi:hypothetical protein
MRPLNNEAFIRSVLIAVVDDCSATMVNTSRVVGTRNTAPNLNRLSGWLYNLGTTVLRNSENRVWYIVAILKNVLKI